MNKPVWHLDKVSRTLHKDCQLYGIEYNGENLDSIVAVLPPEYGVGKWVNHENKVTPVLIDFTQFEVRTQDLDVGDVIVYGSKRADCHSSGWNAFDKWYTWEEPDE